MRSPRAHRSRPAATTVTLVLPVDCALAGAIETRPKASNVIDAVNVLSPCAIVATTRRVVRVPLIALLWIADDDTHTDASIDELPNRALLEPSNNPA